MRTVKLFGAISSTANAVAQVTIPSKGTLKRVQWSLFGDSVTDNADVTAEVSLASASEIGTNGAQQCICEIGWAGNFATSGLAQGGVVGTSELSVPVVQGQIIYLHARVTGTVAARAAFILSY